MMRSVNIPEKKEKSSCYLRKVAPEDVDILFEWVNDWDVRQNSFDTHEISYDEHVEWFDRMMRNPNQAQYILMIDDKPSGQIRVAVEGECAEISYSIPKNTRGLGYGSMIIGLVKKQVNMDYPHIKKLIGRVKPTNAASQRSFIRNGFMEEYRLFMCDMSNKKPDNAAITGSLPGGGY